MSAFSLKESIARATQRVAKTGPRSVRKDRGASRLPAPVEAELGRLLSTQQRPEMTEVAKALAIFAQVGGHRAPSRATLYNALARVELPSYAWDALPSEVQRSLYNLEGAEPSSAGASGTVKGDLLAFYAFNYGSPRAISYASGLPWLCLWRAERRSGWRPKSHALLVAVMKFRGI